MDDARHAVAHFGFDQQHHPPVALRNQRFLHQFLPLQPPQLAFHYLVEAGLGLTGFGAQPAQQRTGVVQHLAGGTDGGADLGVEVAQGGQIFGDGGQQRQFVIAQQFVAAEPGGADEHPQGVEFFAAQQAAQQRPFHRLAQILFRPELQRPAGVGEMAGLGGFLQSGGDDEGIGYGFQPPAAFPPQGSAGEIGQPEPHLVEFQQPRRRRKPAQSRPAIAIIARRAAAARNHTAAAAIVTARRRPFIHKPNPPSVSPCQIRKSPTPIIPPNRPRRPRPSGQHRHRRQGQPSSRCRPTALPP